MDDDQQTDYNARANDMNKISAANTDFLDEAPDPDGPAHPAATSDLPDPTALHETEGADLYEDDLDYDDQAVDPFMNEATDDPTEELQIPPEEYKEEMDKLALSDREIDDDDDMRETIEDRDEDDGNAASNE